MRWLIVLLVVAVVGDAGYATWRTTSSLADARDALNNARDLLSAGDLEAAASAARRATDEADDARSALGQPAIRLVREIPLLGRDIAVVDRLSRAALLSAGATRSGISAAEELGVSQDGVAASVYQDGVVQIDELESAAPALELASTMFGQAKRLVDEAPRALLPPVAEALQDAREVLPEGATSIRKATGLVDAMPALLGGSGDRRYLLAFQATGEARATGGVIGMIGVLHARDGQMELGEVRPYGELFPDPLEEAVDAPAWFEESYGPQFATRQWQQANSSPDFPTDAQVLLEMYELNTGERLDGVIAMDPLALEDMLRGVGSLQVPGGELVTEDNAAEILLKDSYLEFDKPGVQNAYLARLVESFWEELHGGDFDLLRFGEGLGEAARTRHLMLYSTDSDVQAALQEAGVAGDYASSDEQNVQMVFHNAYTVSKVDYFLERDIRTDIRLARDGTAEVEATITMQNNAPSGPPSLLLGPGVAGDPPGLNRMLFNVLAPAGAELETFELDGDDVPIVSFQDDRFPVAWHVIEIEPGQKVTVKFKYRMLEAIQVVRGIPRFRFSMVPQPTVNPNQMSVKVSAPSGLALAPGYAEAEAVTEYQESGKFEETVDLDFVIVDPNR